MTHDQLDPSTAAVPSASKAPQRRLLLGAAVTAALAGMGVAWWKHRVADVSEGAVAGLWSLQWETPEGGVLPMSAYQGKPLLLNFWATWCPPCIDELPLINAFFEQNKANGWQVLGLAVDKQTAVQAFLKKTPLKFPTGMAGLAGADLGRKLGNLAGGLPFTVVFGADGSVRHRKMGRVTAAELEAWARLK